jgi:hypothetical protein
MPIAVREGDRIGTLAAGLTVYRIDAGGRLDFVRKYEVEATAARQQFWSGVVALG